MALPVPLPVRKNPGNGGFPTSVHQDTVARPWRQHGKSLLRCRETGSRSTAPEVAPRPMTSGFHLGSASITWKKRPPNAWLRRIHSETVHKNSPTSKVPEVLTSVRPQQPPARVRSTSLSTEGSHRKPLAHSGTGRSQLRLLSDDGTGSLGTHTHRKRKTGDFRQQ